MDRKVEPGSVLRERPVSRARPEPIERRPDAGYMRADDAAGVACAICGASAGNVGRWKLCFAPLNGLASGTPYIVRPPRPTSLPPPPSSCGRCRPSATKTTQAHAQRADCSHDDKQMLFKTFGISIPVANVCCHGSRGYGELMRNVRWLRTGQAS